MLLAGMESQGLMEVIINSNFWIKVSLKKRAKDKKIYLCFLLPTLVLLVMNRRGGDCLPAVAQGISTAEVASSPIFWRIQQLLHQDAYLIFSPCASRLQITSKWEGMRKFHTSSSSPTQVKCCSIHRNATQTTNKIKDPLLAFFPLAIQICFFCSTALPTQSTCRSSD